MLLHPHSGYEYEDHSIWAMWTGEPWPLDMSIFEQQTQTNEFGVNLAPFPRRFVATN